MKIFIQCENRIILSCKMRKAPICPLTVSSQKSMLSRLLLLCSLPLIRLKEGFPWLTLEVAPLGFSEDGVTLQEGKRGIKEGRFTGERVSGVGGKRLLEGSFWDITHFFFNQKLRATFYQTPFSKYFSPAGHFRILPDRNQILQPQDSLKVSSATIREAIKTWLR